MMAQYDLVVTGGNTAGHVTPLLPVIRIAQRQRWRVLFVASNQGLEEMLAARWGIDFQGIPVGKLRRYFSWENIRDLSRVIRGVAHAMRILHRSRPRVVFSKGGFASVPVIVAARLLGIPVVAHESDSSLSLSSRIAARLGATLCTGFPPKCYGNRGLVYTGIPLREEFTSTCDDLGDRSPRKGSVVLVFFGSLGGSQNLQRTVEEAARELGDGFEVRHILPSNSDRARLGNYVPMPSAFSGFDHFLRQADVVICRAGATTLAELAILRKRAILVPLSLKVSRGDQLRNAAFFTEEVGNTIILPEDDVSPLSLAVAVRKLVSAPQSTTWSLWASMHKEAAEKVFSLLICKATGARSK